MKIIDYTWRSERGSVGIVLTKRSNGFYRAYIGVSSDLSEQEDARQIATWGTRLTFKEASAFFNNLDVNKYHDN